MALAGPILQGAASIYGAVEGGGAAAAASKQAAAIQYLMFQQNRKDTAPWRGAGSYAVNELAKMVNKGPGEYTESPGYKWRLSQGIKGLESSAAARGSQLSGAEMKALTKFGQDYGTLDYDNFLSRYYQSLTPFQSLAGLGMTGTNTLVNAGTNAAGVGGNFLANAGYYQGAGLANAANAFGNAVGQIGSGAGNVGRMIGNYLSTTNYGDSGVGTGSVINPGGSDYSNISAESLNGVGGFL